MLRPALLIVLALAAAPVLAGCVTPASTLETASAGLPAGLLAQPASLFPDHENEPHPAFGWPTLTHPAVNGVVPAWWQPIPNATLPTEIKGLAHLAKSPEQVKAGAGIAVFGRLAVVPADGAATSILDVSDPKAPKLLSQFEPASSTHRGATIEAYPDGRLMTSISTGVGFEVWNITDPIHPTLEAAVKAPQGGHKLGNVPGTPIVYNANSNGGNTNPLLSNTGQGVGETEIYDLTDPAKPVLVQEFKNGYGCHHIFFWIDASQEKYRAICAGIEYTQIWDIKDPKAPKVIVSVPVHHGVPGTPSASVSIVDFSHFSILNEKGDVLIVGDEMGGGGIPPGCTVPGAPTGAMWFYDVKDEKNPQLLGWFSPGTHLLTNPDNPTASCTAHHGRLVPDPQGKRQLITMAFYGAGVLLIDFTDPANVKLVDQWNEGTNTWEAWYVNGYIFTGDLNRGLDVLTLK